MRFVHCTYGSTTAGPTSLPVGYSDARVVALSCSEQVMGTSVNIELPHFSEVFTVATSPSGRVQIVGVSRN